MDENSKISRPSMKGKEGLQEKEIYAEGGGRWMKNITGKEEKLLFPTPYLLRLTLNQKSLLG